MKSAAVRDSNIRQTRIGPGGGNGCEELWTADADGRNENELTYLRPQSLGSPR